jgi:acyl-CoA synthetase (AMP-forming)/AMP-acid ligase II
MLNPLLSPREAAEYLATPRARRGDGGGDGAPGAPGIPKLCVDAADGAVETEFDAALGAAADGGARRARDREAVVIYTSAMDGWARGARLTHRNLAANLHGVIEAMQLTPTTACSASSPGCTPSG